jgi:hypothetical protein
MKYLTIIAYLALGLMLCGCAHEAYYVDHEHGLASRDAFDQQIVNKDYKYAGKPVEGLDGLYAENIMGAYLDTFTDIFTKESVDINATGFSGGSSGSSQ